MQKASQGCKIAVEMPQTNHNIKENFTKTICFIIFQVWFRIVKKVSLDHKPFLINDMRSYLTDGKTNRVICRGHFAPRNTDSQTTWLKGQMKNLIFMDKYTPLFDISIHFFLRISEG